jgi:hypothetical protein
MNSKGEPLKENLILGIAYIHCKRLSERSFLKIKVGVLATIFRNRANPYHLDLLKNPSPLPELKIDD